MVFFFNAILFYFGSTRSIIRQNEVTDRRSWEAYVKEKMEQVPIIDAKKAHFAKKRIICIKKLPIKLSKNHNMFAFCQESGVWNIEMF